MSNATYKQDLHDIAIAVAQNSKNYTDKVADDLKWELGTYDLSVDTNTDTAHIKTLPSDTIQTTVAQVDGVGYKVNQLVTNGNFESADGWNTATTYGTQSVSNNELSITIVSTANNPINNRTYRVMDIVSGHKYLSIVNVLPLYVGTLNIIYDSTYYSATTTLVANSWNNVSSIFTASGDANNYGFQIPTANGDYTIGDVIKYRRIELFDLTADFGSGNEPSTVSDCATAYLPRGINIYEYTPQQSSIKNNAFTGATVVGVNKLPPNLNPNYNQDGSLSPSGNVNTNGVITVNVDASYYYGKGFLLDNYLLPNTTYTFNCVCSNVPSMFYNIYNNNESVVIFNAVRTFTFTTPNVLNNFIIGFSTTSVGTTLSNISITKGSTTPSTYIPYTSQTIPIDLTTIKDSNNVSLFPSGKMMGNSNVADFITPYNQESRWNEVDLGSLDWELGNTFYAEIPNAKLEWFLYQNAVCSKYDLDKTAQSVNDIQDKTFVIGNVYSYVYIKDTSYTSASDFKTAMSGVKLQYERATYLTSNTDLTTLTKINAQSNGTITLNNTDNVDMPNTIKSLKEVAK